MRRVFSSFDLVAAHHARNLLLADGIEARMRNEVLSSGAGEIPPAECQIEVWVLDDDAADRAEWLLRAGSAGASGAGPSWTCPRCGETLEPQFTHCWQCSEARVP